MSVEDLDVRVLVIGAGPHALAFTARFLDSWSVDPFEESPWNAKQFKYNQGEERVTYRFAKSLRQLPSERKQVILNKIRKAQKLQKTRRQQDQLLRVVDIHGDWLCQWKYQFDRLNIKYLRSSSSAHVDPVSWETLGYEIKKEASSSSIPLYRDLPHAPRTDFYHGPFIAPSSSQFTTFCTKVIKRYNLQSIVEKACALSITPHYHSKKKEDSECLHPICYTVRLSTGESVRAQHVVLALGPQHQPKWPDALIDYLPMRQNLNLPLVHSAELLNPGATDEWARLKAKSTKSVLIIGGGLTSAHLLLVLYKHFSGLSEADDFHLTLISRNDFRIQPFDIDLSWMGKNRGHKLARFWSERDFECRARTVIEARNGGATISPEAHESLIHLRSSSSRVEILESTQAIDARYAEHSKQWQVQLQRGEDIVQTRFQSYDYIVCATGTVTNLFDEKLLTAFHKEMDFTSTTNQAKLTPELRISPKQNIYVLGDSAALQLGPGAVNLMGARAGAARIARAIKASLSMDGGEEGFK